MVAGGERKRGNRPELLALGGRQPLIEVAQYSLPQLQLHLEAPAYTLPTLEQPDSTPTPPATQTPDVRPSWTSRTSCQYPRDNHSSTIELPGIALPTTILTYAQSHRESGDRSIHGAWRHWTILPYHWRVSTSSTVLSGATRGTEQPLTSGTDKMSSLEFT